MKAHPLKSTSKQSDGRPEGAGAWEQTREGAIEGLDRGGCGSGQVCSGGEGNVQAVRAKEEDARRFERRPAKEEG